MRSTKLIVECGLWARGLAATELDSRQRDALRNIGHRCGSWLYAEQDPVTSRRVYLRETIKGTDKAAHKRATKPQLAVTRVANQQTQASRAVRDTPSTDILMSHVYALTYADHHSPG